MSWRKRGAARWNVMEALIKSYELDGIGVELGVKEGRFSTHLLEKFPHLFMYGVDMCAPQPVKDRLGYETYDGWDWSEILTEQAQNLKAVSGRFKLLVEDSAEAARHFEDGSVDFVFIDAEHTYEGVKKDIAAWTPKIRKGGLLSGHDYNPNLPRMAGVIRAVNEIGPVDTGSDYVWYKQVT